MPRNLPLFSPQSAPSCLLRDKDGAGGPRGAATCHLQPLSAEGTVPTPGWVLRKGRGGAPVSPTHALREHKPRRGFKFGAFLSGGKTLWFHPL